MMSHTDIIIYIIYFNTQYFIWAIMCTSYDEMIEATTVASIRVKFPEYEYNKQCMKIDKRTIKAMRHDDVSWYD